MPLWYFQDGNGSTHGPFKEKQMRVWLQANYLSENSLLSNERLGPFKSLEEFFPDQNKAFLCSSSLHDIPVPQPLSPTISSQNNNGNTSSERDNWYFKDKHGTSQGPFKRKQMRHWFNSGYLESEVLVCGPGDTQEDYKPLSEIFPNVTDAFLTKEEKESLENGQSYSPRIYHSTTLGSLNERDILESLNRSQGKSSKSSGKSGGTIKKKLLARAAKVKKHARSNSHASILSNSSRRNPFLLKRSRGGTSSHDNPGTLNALVASTQTHSRSLSTSPSKHDNSIILNKISTDISPSQSPKTKDHIEQSNKLPMDLSVDTSFPVDIASLPIPLENDSGSVVELSCNEDLDSDFEEDEESDETWFSPPPSPSDVNHLNRSVSSDFDDVLPPRTVNKKRRDMYIAPTGDMDSVTRKLQVLTSSLRGALKQAEYTSREMEHMRKSQLQTKTVDVLVPMDQDTEELVQENKGLKQTVNNLQDENVLLRSKMNQLAKLLKEKCPDVDPALDTVTETPISWNTTTNHFLSDTTPISKSGGDTPKVIDPQLDKDNETISPQSLAETLSQFDIASTNETAVPAAQHIKQSSSPGKVRITRSSGANSYCDEEILRHYVVLEFNEDSPSLRRQTCELEEEFDTMRITLKRLVKGARGFCASAAADIEAGYQLAEDLCQEDVFRLSPLLAKFGDALRELTEAREIMLQTIEADFIVPVESFVKEDIKEALNLRRELERNRDVFETLEAKYMHHKRTREKTVMGSSRPLQRPHDVVGEQLQGEYQAARGRFDIARFSNTQRLNLLETKKNFQVIQSAAHGLTAFLNYFRDGYQMFAGLAPELEMIKSQARIDQGNFDTVVEQWNQKRIQLESQLHRGAFPFMSKERRQQEMSKPQEKVKVLSKGIKTAVPLHEGYLYKRSSGVRKDWKRRWFVLKLGKLFYYRSWKDTSPQEICDIVLCTVREVKNSDLKNCFEIISAKKRSYMLQAISEYEMNMWMEAIRRAIELQLSSQQHRPSLSRSSGITDPDVQLLLSFNSSCADCNEPGPNWVSINLGVVICIACSGIHRSLGTHLSKIRSLNLDRLTHIQVQLMRRLGNDTVNKIWEQKLIGGVKPFGSAEKGVLENYITRKYKTKEFVAPTDEQVQGVVDKFFDSIEHDRIEDVIWCVAHGVDLNGTIDNSNKFKEERGHVYSHLSNALHVAATKGHTTMCEYLFQNGVKVNQRNGSGQSPMEIAKEYEHGEVVKLFEQKS